MTTQDVPERRPKKIDLNLLPPEYLPQKTPRLTIWLIVAVIILACIPWPFLIMKSSVDSDNDKLQSQLNSLKSQLQQLSAEIAQCNGVMDQVALLDAQLASIEDDYNTFLDMIYLWSVIFDDIRQTPKGSGGELGTIRQQGNIISIEGEFSKEKYIYEYSIMLQETGHFFSEGGITIQSITQTGESGSEMYKFEIETVLKGGGE